MKLTSFDSAACRALRPALDAALKAVADQYGISITTGKMTYAQDTMTVKLECATIGEGGKVATKEAADYTLYASEGLLSGLKPEFLNQSFTSRGRTFVLIGYRSRAQKKSFLIQEPATGKQFIAPLDMIQRGFGVTPSLPF